MHLVLLLSALCSSPTLPAALSADSLRRDMGEVEVKAVRPHAVGGNAQGRIYWDMGALEGMTHVLGSADPLRALQLLPGIATNNDYATGVHVQGCSPAHTIPELDGAPVFDASHLLGLFSVFTASHFRGMSLVKSRHDASFGNMLGGRLAFHPNDSLAHAVHLNATFSFMESEGTLTVPAGGRGTLYLSARGSYLNLLYGGLMDMEEMALDYGLQDYNLTYVVQPDARNKVRLTLYHGQDRTDLLQKDLESDCGLNWQNTVASLNWQWVMPGVAVHQTAFFSRYAGEADFDMEPILLSSGSRLWQGGYKGEVRRALGRAEWDAGLHYSYTELRPMQTRVDGMYMQREAPSYTERAHEVSAYTDFRVPLMPRLRLDGGLRLTYYRRGGRSFLHPVPRVTLQWQPAHGHSTFLHYGMYHQYLHQITLSNGGLPVDFWTSASSDIRPAGAHSVTAGYCFESPRKTWEAGVEVYYKRLRGQYEFNGSIYDILTRTEDVAASLWEGEGENYGADFLLKRNLGRLTGWVSYSLSRSRRRFPDKGLCGWYNAASERRHDLSVAAEYRITPRWSVGGDFVFASGTPYTAVHGLYMISQNLVSEYGRHNGCYLPPTHRMDLSLTWRLPRRRHADHSLNLSVYNVYARRNELFRYLNTFEHKFAYASAYSICRALPSIGYTLKF